VFANSKEAELCVDLNYSSSTSLLFLHRSICSSTNFWFTRFISRARYYAAVKISSQLSFTKQTIRPFIKLKPHHY